MRARGTDGTLTFATTRGDEVSTSVEPPGLPVVVGPTLFGYILEHWDGLLAGDDVEVRFAAVDRGRSYAFTLRLAERDDTTVGIEMRASSFFVRLGVDTIRFDFDARTRRIRHYRGPVPPRLEDMSAFDAEVGYTFVSADFR